MWRGTTKSTKDTKIDQSDLTDRADMGLDNVRFEYGCFEYDGIWSGRGFV